MNKLPERLASERIRLNKTQEEFGALGGVKKLAQFNYEKGVRAPDANYLTAISDAGVDIYYLITGERAVTKAELKEEINAELRCLADAYEAIDTALYEADKILPPNKKRQAAEALYLAFKEGEVDNMGYYAGLMVKAA